MLGTAQLSVGFAAHMPIISVRFSAHGKMLLFDFKKLSFVSNPLLFFEKSILMKPSATRLRGNDMYASLEPETQQSREKSNPSA
jgi:hypothetical protein